VMYLQDGTRQHFMEFLERQFPALRSRFERLYTRKYPPDRYCKEVKALVDVLQRRHGIERRPAVSKETPAEAAASELGQGDFDW